MFDHKHHLKAWLYLAMTLVFGISAAWLGVKLTN